MTILRRNLILLALMLAASGMATALRPTHKIVDSQPALNLAQLIPSSFGGWREEPQTSAYVVDPGQQRALDEIYQQTLSRTYINSAGERIMLSIAYGEDQRDSMQLHFPEVCYPAQGFMLESNQVDLMQTDFGDIRVRRLMTVAGNRHEAVTYWTTIGNQIVRGGTDTKLAQMRYGLRGDIPDGLLFRVSSLSATPADAYRLQDDYTRSLLAALSPVARARLIGPSRGPHVVL